jgi:hypothetical protein
MALHAFTRKNSKTTARKNIVTNFAKLLNALNSYKIPLEVYDCVN